MLLYTCSIPLMQTIGVAVVEWIIRKKAVEEWISQTKGPSIVNSRDRLSPTITTIIINVSFEKIRMNVRQITRRQRRRLMKMDASSLTTTTIIVIIIMKIYIITHRRWSWYILSTILSRGHPSALIIIQHIHFFLQSSFIIIKWSWKIMDSGIVVVVLGCCW